MAIPAKVTAVVNLFVHYFNDVSTLFSIECLCQMNDELKKKKL
jgi:hypothetical protein